MSLMAGQSARRAGQKNAAAIILFIASFVMPTFIVQAQAPGGAGEVLGHAHGPGGVAVPGATVILIDPQTGARKETWTDESGNYDFTSVNPGTYSLHISLVGFREDVREPIPVTSGKPVRVNVALALAGRGEGNLAGRTNGFMPQNLGQSQNFERLPAGSAGGAGGGEANVRFSEDNSEGATGDSSGGSGDLAASPGDVAASATNSFLLSGSVGQAPTPGDRAAMMEQRREQFRNFRQSQGAPGFGGVGEFGGGPFMFFGGFPGRRPQINRIRGNLIERFTNSAFDARPYPLNTSNVPQIASYQEQIGIGLGGPLVIPKIYNGANKTNFFFHYNLQRSKNPINSFATVPTLAERGGDFSQAVTPSGPFAGTVPTLYNPFSNPAGPRTAFAGNVIPSNMIDKAAAGLLAYIPLPNLPGSVQNYHLQESLPSANDRVMARIGHEISEKDNVSVFYFFNSSRSNGVGNFPALTSTNSVRSHSLNLGETHTFNPHLVNTLTFNFTRQRNSTLNPFAFTQNIAGGLGIQGISEDPRDYGIPAIDFTNFTGLNDTIPSLVRNQTARVVDLVILNKGKHNVHFGGDFRRVDMATLNDPNARGTFTFNGFTTSSLTAQGQPVAGTGFDFADFLLGLPQSTSVRYGASSNYFQTWAYSAFVQDDWRASSRLTFDLGLRYENFLPMTEKYGRLSDLEIGPGFSSLGVVTGQSPSALPSSLLRDDGNNFAPRAGLAFRPWTDHSLVMRAGYGIFYDESIYQRLTPNLANQPPFAQASTLLTSPQQQLTLENGFPQLPPGILSNTYAVDPNFRTPYGQSWNLSLEGEIAPNWILTTGYVGTKGSKLDLLLGPNLQLTGSSALLLKNAQQFTYETYGASSIYNGLQVSLRRMFHNGFSVSAEYTYSKSIDDAASVGGAGRTVAQNSQDLRAERGLSVFDMRHRLLINHIYELPFGDRQRYLNHGGLASDLIGNWQISGTTTIQSGTPFTARVLGNQSNNGGSGSYYAERADATGLPVRLPASERSTLDYFNTAAFVLPQPGQFGNAGRNTIAGPGTVNFNMALSRFITFSREKGVGGDFRIEANNVFNTPNFSGLATTIDASNFGRVTSVQAMRSLTLTMRLRF